MKTTQTNVKKNMELVVENTCPMCGEVHSLELDADASASFMAYLMGFGLIQEALPNYSATEREFCKTGYCPKCQSLLFDADTSNSRII